MLKAVEKPTLGLEEIKERFLDSRFLRFEQRDHVFSFSLWPLGVSKGSLIEWTGRPGTGKTEAVLQFLSENPSLKVCWVDLADAEIYPTAFPQLKIDLNRILFLNPGSEFIWTVLQVLRSSLFQILVIQLTELFLGETTLRRFQIAAKKSQMTLFFLTDTPLKGSVWPISQRVQVSWGQSERSVKFQLLKGGKSE